MISPLSYLSVLLGGKAVISPFGRKCTFGFVNFSVLGKLVNLPEVPRAPKDAPVYPPQRPYLDSRYPPSSLKKRFFFFLLPDFASDKSEITVTSRSIQVSTQNTKSCPIGLTRTFRESGVMVLNISTNASRYFT